MLLIFCGKKDARAVLVLYKYCSYFCDFAGICFELVLMLKVSCCFPREKSTQRRFGWSSLWKIWICPSFRMMLHTVSQIKERVLEQTGLKVSSLSIAQVKQRYGIIERENYNKPKSENARQPKCPPEKEAAITEALKYFGMI